jgi:hypothetical protein
VAATPEHLQYLVRLVDKEVKDLSLVEVQQSMVVVVEAVPR